MSSKHIRTDVNLAWPTAEIAVMGPEGAVNIVYGRELAEAVRLAEASEGPLSEERKTAVLADARTARVYEFREQFANPYIAAERGYVDAVILPHQTRQKLIAALEMLDGKRDKNPPKKHGNIPL
jgi:propionyl-CoA carboxylase beta chain